MPPLAPTTPQTSPPVVVPKYSCKFVEDITIKDGCIVRPNQKLTKIWRLVNNGTAPWPPGSKLVHVKGQAPMADTSRIIPCAAPGESADVEAELVTPWVGGHYRTHWQMLHPAGDLFGAMLWCDYEVVAAVAVPPGQTPAPTHALAPVDTPPAPPYSTPTTTTACPATQPTGEHSQH
eukprot:TRINITY_DN2120_c0_g1_i1.p1 TRINITY_DN2120_c0_g1~~TRINITY_DN2120_c0_g1_i1.p1  ORF type:complete len:177 (+),score=43.25 TRINITY_DN2120_c0_g1_i1:170-700(+)